MKRYQIVSNSFFFPSIEMILWFLIKTGHEEIKNLYRPIPSKKIKSVIKNIPKRKNIWPFGFTSEF